MRKFIRDNQLSLVLSAMFLGTLGIGQTLTGLREYNSDQLEHHGGTVSFLAYLGTGHFREATFENWESEFLQMACYIFLTVFLVQRGSAESKKPADEEGSESNAELDDLQPRPGSPWPVRAGGVALKLYQNSLGLFFALAFLATFLLHAQGGAVEYNGDQAAHGEAAHYTTWSYLTTSRFWFESFQNWQSEFLSMVAIVLATVWLRQKGSPESKPVPESHATTQG